MKIKNLIIGSGIGGLAIASEFKHHGELDFFVVDKCKDLPMNLMNGLHYLHSSDFGTPFPFYFKKNILTEQIWDTRNHSFKDKATVEEMFEYSKKIAENLRHPSSIMDPGKRLEVFTPESNNMNDLISEYYKYIGIEKFLLNTELSSIDVERKMAFVKNNSIEETYSIEYTNLISTAPLNKFYSMCGMECELEFKNKELFITNYKTNNIVPNWLIVLYMSDPKFPPYRITCFNGIISMESMRELTHDDEVIVKYIIGDLFDYKLESKENYKWETGRIFGLSRGDRESVINKFIDKDIYLLGRYGLWNGKLIMDSTIKQAKEIASHILYPMNLTKIELTKKLNE